MYIHIYIYSGHILVLMFLSRSFSSNAVVHVHILLRFGCSHKNFLKLFAGIGGFQPFAANSLTFFEPSQIQVQQCIELHDCLENHQSFKLLG